MIFLKQHISCCNSNKGMIPTWCERVMIVLRQACSIPPFFQCTLEHNLRTVLSKQTIVCCYVCCCVESETIICFLSCKTGIRTMDHLYGIWACISWRDWCLSKANTPPPPKKMLFISKVMLELNPVVLLKSNRVLLWNWVAEINKSYLIIHV